MKKYIVGLVIIFSLSFYLKYGVSPAKAATGKIDLFKSVNVPVPSNPFVDLYVRNVSASSAFNVSDVIGSVSMTSSLPYVAQTAIAIWYSPNGSCPADGKYTSYDQIKAGRPGIMNINFTNMWISYPGTVTVPTPYHFSVKRPFSGCVFLTFDVASWPNAAASGSGITATSSMSLLYDTDPPPASPPFASPVGPEACFGTTQGCQGHTTCTNSTCAFMNVTSIANTNKYLWDLYGDVTAGPFSGNPYGNPPTGPWSGSNDMYVYKSCSLPAGVSGPADYYSQIPADAVKLLSVPLQGNGSTPLNIPVSKSFPQPILLTPGDCLVGLVKYSGNGAVAINSQVYALRQVQTSIPTPTPLPSSPPSSGDLNSDGKIDLSDYNILVGNFGKTGTGIQGDLDNNAVVDIFDYNLFLANYPAQTPSPTPKPTAPPTPKPTPVPTATQKPCTRKSCFD